MRRRALFAKFLVFLMLWGMWQPYLLSQDISGVPSFKFQSDFSLFKTQRPKEVEQTALFSLRGVSSEGLTAEEEVTPAPRLKEERKPSRIELEFSRRFGDYLKEELEQFGYDFFAQARRAVAQVGDDYPLGPGDKVKFYFSGDPVEVGVLQSEYVSEVGQDGRLYVPGVGLLSVSGMTLKALRETVSGELLRKYKGLTVHVVLEALRAFNVYVSGYVNNPGMYALTPLDTLISALASAGGVDKRGSLRKVVVRQRTDAGWTEREVDLYEMFVRGKPVDVLLKDGDVIHVGPIGPIVGVGGHVKRPGIYELKDERDLKEVLELAGGIYAFSYPESVKVFRYKDDRVEVLQTRLSDQREERFEVRDGDLIVVEGLAEDIRDLVFIEGEVDHPGAYSTKEVKSLALLLERAKPKVTADLRIGKIVKKDKTTVNFVPEEVLSGQKDLELEDGDRVFIPSKFSREPVYVYGEVAEGRTIPYYEGLTLLDALRDLEFKYDIRELKAVVQTDSETKEVYLYDLFVLSKPDLNLVLAPGAKVVVQRTFRTEKVPTITVLGQVVKPGKYEFRRGMTLVEALRIAGGLAEGAYLKGLILLRRSAREAQRASLEVAFSAIEEALLRQEEGASLWAEEERKLVESGLIRSRQYLSLLRKRTERNLGRIALEVPATLEELERSKANVVLEDGDEIIVPAKPGYVLVLGDVYNPIALPYQAGLRVEDYLEMVGGPTRGADTKDIYVIKANGKVISQRTYGRPFLLGASLMKYKLEEGDAIVVPTKLKVPILWRPLIKDVVQIIFQSISTAVLARRL